MSRFGKKLKKNFDRISIFYRKNEKLCLVPVGEWKPFHVDVDIEPVLIIDLPITADELKKQIQKCFNLCWTSVNNHVRKSMHEKQEPSPIEKALEYKNFTEVVKNYDSCNLVFQKKTKIFTFTKSQKAKTFHYYEGTEFEYSWESIDYGFILQLIQN